MRKTGSAGAKALRLERTIITSRTSSCVEQWHGAVGKGKGFGIL